jgi:prephenate dehydratase
LRDLSEPQKNSPQNRRPLLSSGLSFFYPSMTVATPASTQRPTIVAFQGERGAFSEDAVAILWPHAQPLPLRTVRDVTSSVSARTADAGVLPVENTVFGSVDAARDAIALAGDLYVVAEFVLNIRQCLLASADALLDCIETVESHPVALGQCAQFLSRLPNARERAVNDTAGAARAVAESGDPRRAAIGSARAASIYGLTILADHIEDSSDNQTRFLAVATTPAKIEKGTRARTSIDFTAPDEPGALVRVLDAIASNDLNLSRLDSRPSGKPWTYRFSADIDHSAGDPRLTSALALIKDATHTLRILGTYARATS